MNKGKVRLPRVGWQLRVLIYFLTVVMSALSLLAVCFDIVNDIMTIIIYVTAAIGCVFTCCYLYQDLGYGIKEKVKPGLAANPLTNRLTKDYRYRTVLFSCSSLVLNLFLALSNGVYGIMYHSVWFGALSGYYIILSFMRFLAVEYERRHGGAEASQSLKRKELYAFRNSGILFLVLTAALLVSVLQMSLFGQVRSYPGTLIFAVAAYTFYKIGIAVYHMFKVGKMKSPLLRMIRNINYADAIVSLVSLQTAMMALFGSEAGTESKWLNLLTGGVVCFMIFVMGTYMIRSATKQLRK